MIFFGIAVALFAFVIAGCSKSEKQRIYTIKVDCENVTAPFFFFPAKIFLNGQESVFNSCEDRIRIEAPESLIEESRVIKGQVLLPEGWTNVTMNAHTPLVSPKAVSVDLQIQSAIRPLITVYVDSRGTSPSELSVGQWKRPLPASTGVVGLSDGEKYVANVPAPEKDDAANLVINGTVIGKLPMAKSSTQSRDFVFVDVSGKRKYELTCVAYGHVGCPPGKLLSGKQLYELDHKIDYFLERAPETGVQGARWEFLERR